MIGRELLDNPRADPRAVRVALADIARLNALFGGTRAVVEALEPFFRAARAEARGPVRWRLLDVGTGAGDIPRAVARAAARHGITLSLTAVELNPTAAQLAQRAGIATLLADGGALPVAPHAVDIVTTSQVLHHLPRDVAIGWIARLDRMARRVVVLADLRRSRAAMVGVWLASFPLGMRGLTRHDAVVSLRRGYTREELTAMLREAGVGATARYRRGARVVAAWCPVGAPGAAAVSREAVV